MDTRGLDEKDIGSLAELFSRCKGGNISSEVSEHSIAVRLAHPPYHPPELSGEGTFNFCHDSILAGGERALASDEHSPVNFEIELDEEGIRIHFTMCMQGKTPLLGRGRHRFLDCSLRLEFSAKADDEECD